MATHTYRFLPFPYFPLIIVLVFWGGPEILKGFVQRPHYYLSTVFMYAFSVTHLLEMQK